MAKRIVLTKQVALDASDGMYRPPSTRIAKGQRVTIRAHPTISFDYPNVPLGATGTIVGSAPAPFMRWYGWRVYKVLLDGRARPLEFMAENLRMIRKDAPSVTAPAIKFKRKGSAAREARS